MRKIAIVLSRKVFDSYDDEYRIIADSITDWQEISDEDYALLHNYRHYKDFMIIEQPINTAEFVAKTVDAFKALAKKQAKEEAERIATEAAKKQERAERRAAKKLGDKRKMLELLKAELGED